LKLKLILKLLALLLTTDKFSDLHSSGKPHAGWTLHLLV